MSRMIGASAEETPDSLLSCKCEIELVVHEICPRKGRGRNDNAVDEKR